MQSNRLQPNPDKTEVLWCVTIRRQHRLPTSPLLIDGCSVTPVSTLHDLSIYIDSDLSMQAHVKYTVLRCFASLRWLRQIRRCVPPVTLQMMVVALVHSRLDYGNGVLVGLPAYLMRQLQSVLNAAARLIFRLKTSDHITDALVGSSTSSPLWRSKCCMDAHQATSGHSSASPMCLVVEHSTPPTRIISWCRLSRLLPLAVEPSQSLPHESETLFPMTSFLLNHCQPSKDS